MGRVTKIFRPEIGSDGLSNLQRDTLRHVQAIEVDGEPVTIRTFAARVRGSYASAQARLATLAAKGHLRIVVAGIKGQRQQEYASAQVRAIGTAAPRVVIRKGQRITICPPAYAAGALIWPSVLGRGRSPRTSS